MRKKTNILDCTLRDGSYHINYSFSPNDTKKVVKNLIKKKIIKIEIGHGLGIGAYKNSKKKTRHSDLQIIKSLKDLKLNNVEIGMFSQPSYTNLDDLRALIDSGLNFLRIGTQPKDFNTSTQLLNLCIKHKVKTYIFLMQSHKSTPKEFSIIANKAQKMGFYGIYLVDSTGCMYPKNINEYYSSFKEVDNKIIIGFHGHNNLGMANINTIRAFDLGFDLVDATLGGIGRSSGNACLEQILHYLSINKLYSKNNILNLLKFSDSFFKKKKIRPNFYSKDIFFGIYKIHSEHKNNKNLF
jgi:isopropylmalate/homocitrate/citramalate synthase